MKMQKKLSRKATDLRLDILQAVKSAGRGHIGGAYSMIDILAALYHSGFLRYDAKAPNWSGRDWFVLSKGHAGVGLYAILADCGFFPKEELFKLNNGSLLGEHPDISIPGIETVGGSLGHGLGIAAGFALSVKQDGSDRRAVVLMGDGECYEGSVWEAAIFAAQQSLGNLLLVIDRNGLIATGKTETVSRLEPLEEKWTSFGWNVISLDGHNVRSILGALSGIKRSNHAKPTVIIAETVKGKGVSFMENKIEWHHSGLNDEEYRLAKNELTKLLVD